MKIWTESEISAIIARYPHEPNAALAQFFGVTERTLRSKAHRLALTKQPKPGALVRGRNHAPVWTEAQDAEIRRWWPEINGRVPGRTTAWLAQRLNVGRGSLQHRAAVLGLRQARFKESPWSEDELELLDQWLHLPPSTIRKRLAKQKYRRSEGAIINQRLRQFGGLCMATGAYSAGQLAEMMGVSPPVVLKWIAKGYLKATMRGDSRNDRGGPGDRWLITPRAVKTFLLDNPTLIYPKGLHFVWLLDLFQPAANCGKPLTTGPRRAGESSETRCAA